MKLFNKKEEKNKVGRPKLADTITKKKAIISISIALVMVVALLLTGAFKLNIIKFNKLKGVAVCSEIPAEFQPGGNHEYGFTDLNFYSTVVRAISSGNDTSYCTTVTEEQLASLTSLSVSNLGNYYNTDVENVEGIQYLTGLTRLFIYEESNVTSIDLSHNDLLEDLTIYGSKLTEINLTDKLKLKKISLSNNKLTSINLNNNFDLTELYLRGNDIKDIDLSNNHYINKLDLYNNPNLESIDLSGNIALTEFQWIAEFGQSPKLKTLNLDGTTELQRVIIDGSSLSSLNLDDNTKLSVLSLENNDFTTINISNNINLDTIRIREKLNSLDLKSNTKLTSLAISDVNIDVLDLTNNKELGSLTLLGNTKIGVLDVSGNKKIYNINAIDNNDVDILNLSGLTSLKKFDTKGIEAKKLNLRDSNNITWLSIPDGLEELDVSNTKITSLNKDTGKLKKIDVSNNDQITEIDLPNHNIIEINMDNTPNLNTIKLNNNKISSIDLSKMPSLKRVNLSNNDLSEINLKNNVLLAELDLGNNNFIGEMDLRNNINLENIWIYNNKLNKVLLPDNNILNGLILSNNNLAGTLDLSKYNNLYSVYLDNNNFDDVILGNNEVLEELLLHNNNLKKIDLSNVPNLNVFTIEGNPITNTIYLLKNKTLNYNKDIMLNENRKPTYDVSDNNLVLYENGMLKALKEGITTVKISNENIPSYKIEYLDKCLFVSQENEEYCSNINEEDVMLPYFLSQEIKVYDITSDVYKIDKEKKTIDASGLDLDISKIKLTLEGLSVVVSGDNFIIKDGETIVDTYKILNMKKVVDTPSNSNGNNTNNTTTKKSGSNTKTTTKKKATTTEDLSDIEINGSFVSILALQQAKGKDRNIVVKNDGITVTINGKDIEKIEGNLDLSYELKVLKESFIYDEVKDKVSSGMVLNFKNNNILPGKVLISLDLTDIIKKNAGTKNLRLYSYKNGELTLVAENINPKEKKLSFYVNELGSYVLTDKELTGKSIKEDTKLLESNNKINKGISFRCILWLILILIILGIIGYVIYKKNKDKNKND